MRRRQLLALLALALPAALGAQPARRPRRVVYLIHGGPKDGETGTARLAEGLRARGWNLGADLVLEPRYAEGSTEVLARATAEAVGGAPDVIVTSGPAASMALKKTGTALPVVFVGVFDPVGLGLGESLARPGGNFTGLSTAVPDTFFSKQLELLREAVPRLKRLALLSNPQNPIHTRFRDRRLKGLAEHTLEPVEVYAGTAEELEPALRAAAERGAQAIYVGGDPLTRRERARIAELALRHRLPTMFLFFENVEAGGLMSYGTNFEDLQRRAAPYVDRILRGAKPGELAIEQPAKFDLVVNLRTARALGLSVPQSLLIRADRVVE